MTELKSKIPERETIESFATKQLELLEIERDAEIEENKCLQECFSLKTLQKKGLCVPKLRCANISTGLFGRIIVKFISSYGNNALSSHVISSGDIVGIGNPNADGKFTVITSGVVSSAHESYFTVALEKNSDSSDLDCDDVYSVIKLANDVTYKRLKRIIKVLHRESDRIFLASFLFGLKSPTTLECAFNTKFYNENLNDTQKEAVKFALSQKEVAILHGPPGTGKTTTLVECILQAVALKQKVIACAPSNIAVDNLIEKLAPYKVKIVRLGHPARALVDIQKYSLDAIVSQYDGSDVIDDMQLEISKLKTKIENAKRSAARKSLWAENKNLLKEMKERQKSIVKQVLTNADIVLSTLTSASLDGPLKHVGKDHFDVCFIDECSQALEIACWIPLEYVKKCVIAGDHNQLPPTIVSEKAAKSGLSVTLMERLLKLYGESIKKMLTLQYRMHEVIMQWPSKQLYEGKLMAHESVSSHLLSDLSNVESNDDTIVPLVLIDTDGCNLYELQDEDEESKGNEGEADLVVIHIESLVRSGVKPSDIAVITPYNLQVDLIKSRCSGKYSKLEIKSVDGFQGREKEAVILSLVRSNDEGEVGFLSEDRRINVAITRAKRHLAVFCNSNTVSNSTFLKSFIEYCEGKGEVRSAFQYENQIGQYPISQKQKERKAPKSKQFVPKQQKKTTYKNDISSDFVPSIKEENKLDKEKKRILAEEKFTQVINDFMNSKNSSLSFSPELSAFERRIVHEISETMGLNHVSQGENEERCIIVSKVKLDANNLKLSLEAKQSKSIGAEEKYSCFGAEKIPPKIIGGEKIPPKSIPPAEKNNKESSAVDNTFNKNTVDKDNNQNPTAKANPIKSSRVKTSNTKQKSSKTKLLGKNDSESQIEDFDALIAAAVKSDNTCHFNTCKKSVVILSQVCKFCNGRFCFSHFIPEAHGCGHLAKLEARSQIRKEGKLYAGSGKPEKKIDPLKQSYLQKKLNEKINSLSNQRKVKTKN